MVGHPSNLKYKDIVSKKMLPNCPITTYATNNADYTFGPHLSGTRGNIVRKKQSRAETEEYVKIPEDFTYCTSL